MQKIRQAYITARGFFAENIGRALVAVLDKLPEDKRRAAHVRLCKRHMRLMQQRSQAAFRREARYNTAASIERAAQVACRGSYYDVAADLKRLQREQDHAEVVALQQEIDAVKASIPGIQQRAQDSIAGAKAQIAELQASRLTAVRKRDAR